MSLIASRIGCTHRCTIERNAGSADAWGGTATDWQTHLTDQPCRSFVDSARERATEGSDVVIAARTVLLPPGVDVVAISDRVASVTDADGNALEDGPMRIHSVVTRPGHIELTLERTQ